MLCQHVKQGSPDMNKNWISIDFHQIVFNNVSGSLLGIEIHPHLNHISLTTHNLDINTENNMFGHP
jgi:hypothetical protein